MEPVAEFTILGWAFSGRVRSDQILPGWISQLGRLEIQTFFMFIEISHVQKQSKQCTQEGSLARVMEISSEVTFQSTSQEINSADSDVLQRLDRFTETVATSTNEVT